MDTPTQVPDHVLSIHIAAPVTAVWEEITKTGRVQRALYNTVLECELKPGSRLRYYSPNKKRVFIVGEVVEVDPPHRFSYTYVFTTRVADPTLVTWELTEENGGCRVTLTQGVSDAAPKASEKVAAGWTQILGLLKHQLETGDVPRKTRIIYRIMGWCMFLMPKTTTAEYADRQGW